MEKEPRCLYDISKETGIPYPSVHLAVERLAKEKLQLNAAASHKTDRKEKVYVPTFKGFLEILCTYDLKPPETARLCLLSESDELARKRLLEQVRKEHARFGRDVSNPRRIVERNGALLQYPLLQHCSIFERAVDPSVLYQALVKIAYDVLRASQLPPSKWFVVSEETYRSEKKGP